MKKILSMAVIIAMMAGLIAGMTVTVSARSVSSITQVPLSFFDRDSEWRPASGNFASMPNVIQGSIDTTRCETGSRTWGGDTSNPISAAKEPDDSYITLKTLPTSTSVLDSYFDLINFKSPTMDRVQLAAGDANVITVSIDIATSNVKSGTNKEFFNSETNSSTTITSSNTWGSNGYIDKTSGKIGTVQCVSNQWHNVVFEIGGTSATEYKYYVDGVLAGSSAFTKGYLGLLRVGVKTQVGKADDMAFDNYSLRVGEPFTMDRYNADKVAKALNYKHIKNQNTNKNEITSDLDLISALPGDTSGTRITWVSDKEDVISSAGVVTRGLNNEDVKLTATINTNGKTDTKNIYVTVLQASGRPDTANDLDTLTESVILGSNASLDNITSNLTLPTVGASGNTAIAWSSTNEAAVSTSGTVTRGANPISVKITASISKEGEQTLTKEFSLTLAADFNKVNKTALQALLAANENLMPEDYTQDSYTAFEDKFYESMDIATSTGFTQVEVDVAKAALEKVVANLVYAVGDTVYSDGQVTKDTFVQKGLSGNPTATDLLAKYPVTEMSQGTARKIYVGFDIKNINAESNKVYLKLYFTQLGANNLYEETVSVHSVGNGWIEAGLTWANMPTNYSLAPLATHGPENIHKDNPATAGNTRYISFDISDYVMQQKSLGATEVSFVLGGSNNGSGYMVVDSREKMGGNPPQITAEKLPTIENTINDDLKGITLPDAITQAQTLSLPATGSVNGYEIQWTSSNPIVISNSGVVTLPDSEETVTLTATIQSNGLTYTKAFNIGVKKVTLDELDCNALTFDVIKGANTSETDVRYNLDLIPRGINGTPITWTTSNGYMISSNGTVLRDALANAQDVTLTATVGGFAKDFNLRVAGDVYASDDCKTLNNVYSKTSDLTITTESTWRITGFTHSANGKTNQYVVYKAAEGASFEVQTVVNGIGSNRVLFFVSEDNITYTSFTSVSESAAVRPIGEYGGYSYLTYNSTVTLPAGTRYLKIAIPNTDKAWRHFLTNVKITLPKDEITFGDIKANNFNGNNINANMNLQTAFADAAVAWSSDSAAILSNGAFVRPAADTDVKLTAVITKGNTVTTKVYNVTAKAYASRVAVLDKPFVWYISETNKIAGVRVDSAFGALRSDSTTNKMFTSCDVVNMTEQDQKVTLVLVIYNDLGNMIDVKYQTVTVPNATSATQTLSLEKLLTPEANYAKSRIKAFVWDNSLSPLINTAFDITRLN